MNWKTILSKKTWYDENRTALAIIHELRGLQDSTLKVQALAVKSHIRQLIVRLMENDKGGEK